MVPSRAKRYTPGATGPCQVPHQSKGQQGTGHGNADEFAISSSGLLLVLFHVPEDEVVGHHTNDNDHRKDEADIGIDE